MNMKKKVATLGLVAAMLLTSAGATLAYFTDTAEAENVFTTGNVDIELEEVFDSKNAKLMPGIDIQKEIDVKNIGSEEAFVRVHIAVPSMLDSGSEDEPQYAAYNNTLHWNMAKDTMGEGKWNWNSNADGSNYPGNGGTWNMYQQEVDGIMYNVYVATYETALAKGEVADNAIHKVYLDKKVTNEQMTEITKVLGANPKILVVAEGAQVAGFEEKPYEALNTQFGVPGSYNPFA